MSTNLSRHQPAPQRFLVMGMYLTVEEFYRLKAATYEFFDHMNAYMRRAGGTGSRQQD